MKSHCHKRGRRSAWPFVAMMGAGRGWGAFGPEGPFGPGGPFGADGPYGGRRRRGRMFGTGELRLVLLKLIADEPRHGYELIKAIEELTGGSYSPSPGTIYPTLSLLEDEGAIAGTAGDEARKAYEATEAGRKELADRAEEADELIARLSAQAEERKPFASPDLFRAVGNLATVLKNRAREGRFDDQTRREVVDLIDELAKKVERL